MEDFAQRVTQAVERALSGEPAPPPKEPSRKKGAGLSIVGGLGLLAGGLAVALVPGAREACLGWAQDRWEDVAPMPAEERHRLRRLRRWRRLLAPGAREAWVKELGPELRGLRPASGYQARLEVELVMGPPGAALGAVAGALHAEELVWLQDARGQWRMVPGLLDPANEEGLLLPAALAHDLGFVDEDGAPVSAAGEGWEPVAEGAVTYSVAGREFVEGTPTFLPPPTRTQLQAAAAAGPSALAALARAQRLAVVPARTIRALQRAGLVVRSDERRAGTARRAPACPPSPAAQ